MCYALQEVAQKSFGTFILTNIQNLTEQSALADPVLSREIGPDDHQRYIPPAANIGMVLSKTFTSEISIYTIMKFRNYANYEKTAMILLM